MRKILVTLAIGAVMTAASFAVAARAIVDGRLQVEPSGENRYIVDNNKLGKAEFFGYVGDFVETKKITGIVLLKRGEKEKIKNTHVAALAGIARDLKVTAYVEDNDGHLKIIQVVE